MKTIKDITVEVTYKVSLGDIEVSDEVSEQLDTIYEEGGACDSNTVHFAVPKIADAFEWLADNIREADASDWAYEIIDLEEDKP
jgi:hypothetical protein